MIIFAPFFYVLLGIAMVIAEFKTGGLVIKLINGIFAFLGEMIDGFLFGRR